MKKVDKVDEQKIEDVKKASGAGRLAKYGKAGPHSSKSGDKGYSRKQKHKEKVDDESRDSRAG